MRLPALLLVCCLAALAGTQTVTAQRRQSRQQLQTQVGQLTAKLEESRAQNAALTADLHAANQHREAAEAETRALRTLRVQLEGEVGALRAQLNEAVSKLGGLPAVEAERDALRQRVEVLLQDPWNEQWDEFYAAYEQRGKMVAALQAEVTRLRQQAAEAEITYRQAGDRVLAAERAAAQSFQLAAELATVKAHLAECLRSRPPDPNEEQARALRENEHLRAFRAFVEGKAPGMVAEWEAAETFRIPPPEPQ